MRLSTQTTGTPETPSTFHIKCPGKGTKQPEPTLYCDLSYSLRQESARCRPCIVTRLILFAKSQHVADLVLWPILFSSPRVSMLPTLYCDLSYSLRQESAGSWLCIVTCLILFAKSQYIADLVLWPVLFFAKSQHVADLVLWPVLFSSPRVSKLPTLYCDLSYSLPRVSMVPTLYCDLSYSLRQESAHSWPCIVTCLILFAKSQHVAALVLWPVLFSSPRVSMLPTLHCDPSYSLLQESAHCRPCIVTRLILFSKSQHVADLVLWPVLFSLPRVSMLPTLYCDLSYSLCQESACCRPCIVTCLILFSKSQHVADLVLWPVLFSLPRVSMLPTMYCDLSYSLLQESACCRPCIVTCLILFAKSQHVADHVLWPVLFSSPRVSMLPTLYCDLSYSLRLILFTLRQSNTTHSF